MMLLPLAERMLAGGAATRIELAITTEADRLHMRLAADRPPPGGEDKTIAALRERLAALFGDQAKLEIAGSEARLDIPFEATGFEAAPVPA